MMFNGAYELAQEFADDDMPFAAIIKHANPCGASLGGSLAEAFQQARAADPISAFGEIQRSHSRPHRRSHCGCPSPDQTHFFEVIIAPGYDDDAFKVLTLGKMGRKPHSA